jgi:tetratricopeptide (TPR) repeat protein
MMRWQVLFAILISIATPAYAGSDNEPGSRTVIGPRNIHLYDGANTLLAGDSKEGVRLTLLGLNAAHGAREVKIAHANLCAGFLLLEQLDTALEHCNWVLERDDRHWRTYNNRALVYLRMERFEESREDIRRGQEINPKSENLKEVKGMYLDETEPVVEQILMDERRRKTKPPILTKPDDEVE